MLGSKPAQFSEGLLREVTLREIGKPELRVVRGVRQAPALSELITGPELPRKPVVVSRVGADDVFDHTEIAGVICGCVIAPRGEHPAPRRIVG